MPSVPGSRMLAHRDPGLIAVTPTGVGNGRSHDHSGRIPRFHRPVAAPVCIVPVCIVPVCIVPGCIVPGCIVPGCIVPGCIPVGMPAISLGWSPVFIGTPPQVSAATTNRPRQGSQRRSALQVNQICPLPRRVRLRSRWRPSGSRRKVVARLRTRFDESLLDVPKAGATHQPGSVGQRKSRACIHARVSRQPQLVLYVRVIAILESQSKMSGMNT